MWCRYSLDWIIVMTKNKKRKFDVREIAKAKGIGVARANLLNERHRSASPTPLAELDIAIEWEKNLSWSLDTDRGTKINVPFTSLHPHYLISGGMYGQRKRFIDAISDGVYNRVSTFVYILTPEDSEGAFVKLKGMHLARLNALGGENQDSIADVRMQALTAHGTEYMKRDVWKYFFVLIPELEAVLASVSDEAKDVLRDLIMDGRKSGIHVIACTDGTGDDSHPIYDSSLMEDIIVEEVGEIRTDYAVMMNHGSPARVKIVQPPFWVMPTAKW